MLDKSDSWIAMPRFLLRKSALNSMLKKLDLKNKKCLEIGFGAGEILKLIASKGAKITGLDFSESAYNLAQKRLSTFKHTNNIHITTNVDELVNQTYDIVLAFEVLEHIKDDELCLAQWLNYLKPGGSLFLSVPAHMSKWGDNDVWAGHYRRYEKNDLIQLFNDQDARIIQFWNYGYPLTIILDRLLHKSKKTEAQIIKSTGTDIEELTKKSGIERDNKLIYKIISNDLILFPFYLLQKLFFNTDLGSQYILHIQKS